MPLLINGEFNGYVSLFIIVSLGTPLFNFIISMQQSAAKAAAEAAAAEKIKEDQAMAPKPINAPSRTGRKTAAEKKCMSSPPRKRRRPTDVDGTRER